jgi:hypothetical protein
MIYHDTYLTTYFWNCDKIGQLDSVRSVIYCFPNADPALFFRFMNPWIQKSEKNIFGLGLFCTCTCSFP